MITVMAMSQSTCILRAAVSACASFAVRLIRRTSYCYVTPFMGKQIYTQVGQIKRDHSVQ